jgi:hypothetical protein
VLSHQTLSFTSPLIIDFDGATYQEVSVTGSVSLQTSNRGVPKTVAVIFRGGASDNPVSVPAGWKWVSAVLNLIPANKTVILSLTAFGTLESDVIACFVAEE